MSPQVGRRPVRHWEEQRVPTAGSRRKEAAGQSGSDAQLRLVLRVKSDTYIYIHTHIYNIYIGASLVVQSVKDLPAVQETRV